MLSSKRAHEGCTLEVRPLSPPICGRELQTFAKIESCPNVGNDSPRLPCTPIDGSGESVNDFVSIQLHSEHNDNRKPTNPTPHRPDNCNQIFQSTEWEHFVSVIQRKTLLFTNRPYVRVVYHHDSFSQRLFQSPFINRICWLFLAKMGFILPCCAIASLVWWFILASQQDQTSHTYFLINTIFTLFFYTVFFMVFQADVMVMALKRFDTLFVLFNIIVNMTTIAANMGWNWEGRLWVIFITFLYLNALIMDGYPQSFRSINRLLQPFAAQLPDPSHVQYHEQQSLSYQDQSPQPVRASLQRQSIHRNDSLVAENKPGHPLKRRNSDFIDALRGPSCSIDDSLSGAPKRSASAPHLPGCSQGQRTKQHKSLHQLLNSDALSRDDIEVYRQLMKCFACVDLAMNPQNGKSLWKSRFTFRLRAAGPTTWAALALSISCQTIVLVLVETGCFPAYADSSVKVFWITFSTHLLFKTSSINIVIFLLRRLWIALRTPFQMFAMHQQLICIPLFRKWEEHMADILCQLDALQQRKEARSDDAIHLSDTLADLPNITNRTMAIPSLPSSDSVSSQPSHSVSIESLADYNHSLYRAKPNIERKSRMSYILGVSPFDFHEFEADGDLLAHMFPKEKALKLRQVISRIIPLTAILWAVGSVCFIVALFRNDPRMYWVNVISYFGAIIHYLLFFLIHQYDSMLIAAASFDGIYLQCVNIAFCLAMADYMQWDGERVYLGLFNFMLAFTFLIVHDSSPRSLRLFQKTFQRYTQAALHIREMPYRYLELVYLILDAYFPSLRQHQICLQQILTERYPRSFMDALREVSLTVRFVSIVDWFTMMYGFVFIIYISVLIEYNAIDGGVDRQIQMLGSWSLTSIIRACVANTFLLLGRRTLWKIWNPFYCPSIQRGIFKYPRVKCINDL
eukprot:TRINITY_DN10259_c0_g1_i1.p1 TRINITY_DN10259_c0_g1~~TRINITY_DN10259_c0_g1_i1.p1  ORF type:complete len:911 (-),score=140.06 TRINITY_DN10259_c0_g1_i1:286-3018(-)